MKSLWITLFACLCLSSAIRAQNYQVTYDFETGQVEYPEGKGGEVFEDCKVLKTILANKRKKINPKGGDLVTVKFTNLNTLLYDVEVAGKSISHFQEVPAVLRTTLIAPIQLDAGQTAASIKELEVEKQSLSNGAAPNPLIPLIQKEIASSKELLQCFQALEQVKTLMTGLQGIAYSPATSSSNILLRRDGILDDFASRVGKSVPSSGDTLTWLHEVMHDCLKDFRVAKRKFDLEHAGLLASSMDPSINQTAAELKSTYDKLGQQVDDQNYPVLFQEISAWYERLNSQAFSIVSQPLKVGSHADEFALGIKISPRMNLANLPPRPAREFADTLHIRGGWRFDFSVGTGIHNLADPTYTTRLNGAGAAEIIEELTGKQRVSIMSLAHARYRVCKDFSGGISTGVMLDTDTRLRYLLGGSLFLGRSNRFVLSGGLAIGNVARLSAVNPEKSVLAAGSEIQTIDKLKTGAYMGLSIDLTR